MTIDVPFLQAISVTASRAGEDGRRQSVVNEANLSVNAGEVLAIVGPSGSGKSTLLRLFNRLLEPDSGEVLFAGENIQKLDPQSLRASLPLVAQKPYLFSGTVQENLQASARLRRSVPPVFSDPESQEILELCQVDTSWLPRDGRKLSIGQQQRVCLARALFGPCQALLLDEPTSALDRPTADLLAKTFRQLAEKKKLAMIIVTHDLRVAELCADRVAILLDGEIIEEGPAEKVMQSPETESARKFLVAEPVNGGVRAS